MRRDSGKGNELFEYDKIVIGSSLSAVLYAFNNNYPIFFAEERRPLRFDYLEPELELSCLKIPGAAKSLTTFNGEKEVGNSKESLWERLLFLLSMNGKVPLSNLCQSMRYDGNTLTCFNEYSKIMEFSFNDCIYFGDNKSSGVAVEKGLDEDKYICYDHIAFNKGGKHQIDYIETSDNFVREIWFYSSDRIDGNTPVKDACALSILNKEQLLEFDFSETMARFKVVYEMESRGMKGLFAHGYTTAGNPKHYKFRTTSMHRQTRKQHNEYEPHADNVSIAKVSQEDLLAALPTACMAYDRFLRDR